MAVYRLPTPASAIRGARRTASATAGAPPRAPSAARVPSAQAASSAIASPAAAARSSRLPAVALALTLWACLALVLAFLTLPVAAVFLDSSPTRLLESLGEPSSTEALLLSLQTTIAALALVVALGTPVAWLLASRSFPGKAAVTTLIELPLVLPPAVAGVGLLAALGPHGLLGPALADAHIRLVLAKAGVVVALAFVSFPFFVRQAQESLAAVDRAYIDAARVLGASELGSVVRIAIPIALPGLAAGVALAWARALGEFGATLMFAGSVQGLTQTLPLAIYSRFATDFQGALALSAVLVAISLTILLAVKLTFRPR